MKVEDNYFVDFAGLLFQHCCLSTSEGVLAGFVASHHNSGLIMLIFNRTNS